MVAEDPQGCQALGFALYLATHGFERRSGRLARQFIVVHNQYVRYPSENHNSTLSLSREEFPGVAPEKYSPFKGMIQQQNVFDRIQCNMFAKCSV
jgi:hypothetical protein